MTTKIAKTCTMCGSADIGPSGECLNCHHVPGKNCEACSCLLDERGLCARCARVMPEDLEALKWVLISWTVCAVHGAHETQGRDTHYRASWKTVNPKDKRKKIDHHEWRHRCYPCTKNVNRFLKSDEAQTFSDRIMIPAEVYQKLIDERLARWKDRK